MTALTPASDAPLLARVAARLREAPSLRPVLELLADPDAVLAADAPGAAQTSAAARRINEARSSVLVGAFLAHGLSTDEVRARLGGVSRQAVSERVRGGRLLGSRVRGSLSIPAWQFDSGGLAPRLHEVLGVLAIRESAVAADAWMRQPIPEEGGRSAADLFVVGEVDLALHYLRVSAP
jgi:hypothetical protein